MTTNIDDAVGNWKVKEKEFYNNDSPSEYRIEFVTEALKINKI
jgi:hypothetical protein